MPEQTVQQFIDSGDSYHWYCDDPECGHSGEVPMLLFRDKFGADHSSLSPAMREHLHCTRCKGQRISLVRTPKGNENRRPKEPVNAYLKAKGG